MAKTADVMEDLIDATIDLRAAVGALREDLAERVLGGGDTTDLVRDWARVRDTHVVPLQAEIAMLLEDMAAANAWLASVA